MGDFLSFRKMITPIVIQVIFWLSIIVCEIGGLLSIFQGLQRKQMEMALAGALAMAIGPLAVRIYCEMLILFFRINDTLTEIHKTLSRQEQRQLQQAQRPQA